MVQGLFSLCEQTSGTAAGKRRSMRKILNVVGLLSLIAVLSGIAVAQDVLEISAVSTRPSMVSGGDVLVRIDLPEGVQPGQVAVELNDQDVTSTFQAVSDTSLLGLVEGLQEGENTLVASTEGQAPAQLTLINHPITGPVFSGPHEEPFICMTESFTLVTGETLGPSLDESCSIETRVDYVYRSTDGTMKPLPDLTERPADLADTTTSEGTTVPYIVRVETGTINRAIYETAMLHDPSQPEPDPWTSNPAWNGRLIYRQGGGCRSGWYVQGDRTGGVLDDVMLSRGYATAASSLNVFANNCNDLLASETTMMVKEQFIESYGEPQFTIGWGSSGGSYQSHQTADNYPGLFDGIIVGRSFPDVTSATIFTLADARLLEHYFTETAPDLFTQEEERAVSGFRVWESIPNLSEGAARIDAVEDYLAAEFKSQDVVPGRLRYDPDTNPEGARATVYDHTVNVYGRDPETGFARRPLDNVGVQYGLEVLNSGEISVEQFLDLNEQIGGLDINGNFTAERTVADPEATRAAYRTGRILNGGGGLATTPIIDYRNYTDDRPGGDIHMRVHSFATRERLINANGHADNQVMLVRDDTFSFGFGSAFSSTETNEVLYEALNLMDQWLVNLEQIASGEPTSSEVVQAKPEELVDACWTPGEESDKIEEPQTFDGPGECNELYPSFPTPREVGGAPLANDIVKCQLKPIDMSDYQITFTSEQEAQLREIFPEGVCDWTQPSLYWEPLQTWWSYEN